MEKPKPIAAISITSLDTDGRMIKFDIEPTYDATHLLDFGTVTVYGTRARVLRVSGTYTFKDVLEYMLLNGAVYADTYRKERLRW